MPANKKTHSSDGDGDSDSDEYEDNMPLGVRDHEKER